MAKLKPCPFCEGVGLYIHQETEEQWLVVCLDCGASGPEGASKQAAIDAWNKRS